MKKALLAAVLAVVSMLGGLPAQAAAQADDVGPAACHEEWMGIRDFPKDLDSRRFVNLRMAWRVTYCDGTPRSLKSYLAVYCHFDGLPWPCSFSWTVVAQDHGTVYEDSENVNPNTGSDGFASRYGPSRTVTRCHTYHVYGSISRVGVAGVVFPGIQAGGAAYDFNPCS
jgi:hypothetical protein